MLSIEYINFTLCLSTNNFAAHISLDKSLTRITVAISDEIDPEILNPPLDIPLATIAHVDLDEKQVGEQVDLAGNRVGISTESWDVIRHNRVTIT